MGPEPGIKNGQEASQRSKCLWIPSRTPFAATGKPEALKHGLAGDGSRRTKHEHRGSSMHTAWWTRRKPTRC
ncbi:MAG: type II toxin-antitoxin system YoeB family toxin [Synechococcaceae cyanobacterium]